MIDLLLTAIVAALVGAWLGYKKGSYFANKENFALTEALKDVLDCIDEQRKSFLMVIDHLDPNLAMSLRNAIKLPSDP